MLLAGSAGVAGAATTATSPPDSWFGWMADQVECAFGNQSACAALTNSAPDGVHADAPGDPKIKNQ